MSAGSSECNKYPTVSLLVIDIVGMVSYGCSTFKGEPGLALRCLLDFSPLQKGSISRRGQQILILREDTQPFKLSQSAFECRKIVLWNGTSEDTVRLASTLTNS